MINLIPPELKEERRYGRLNKFMFHQLAGLVAVGVLAVGFMLSGLQLVNQDEKLIKESITAKQTEYEPLQEYETLAQDLNKEIKTIGQLFERELQFSSLLVKIAQSIPSDSRLTSLSLQDGIDKPLTITAIVGTQEGAGVLRKSLVDSENFTTADILNITNGETNDEGVILNYNATITATISEEAKLSQQDVDKNEPEEATTTANEQAEPDATAPPSTTTAEAEDG